MRKVTDRQMTIRLFGLILFLILMIPVTRQTCQAQISFGSLDKEAAAKSENPKETDGATLGASFTRKYRAGMILEAAAGSPCTNVFGTVPVPMEFPEQKIRILEENFPDNIRVGYRELKEGGAKELVLKMRTLRAGQRVEVSVLTEVTRFQQFPPKQTDGYVIPKKTGREFKYYLRESPYIEAGSRKIRELARQATKEATTDWNKVQAIFDFVRTNVKYKEELAEKPMRGAMAALRNKEGDCEDMCALFIAMCRSLDIPARLVRVTGHCYSEFYLWDSSNNGHWFPAQVAGTEPMGGMQDTRVILQKGDNFHLPESSKTSSLYVKELFTGSVKEGARDPRFQFIQEDVE